MISFLKDIYKLRILLPINALWEFVFLLILMFIASILEAVGLGAIPLFISLVTDPGTLSSNKWIGRWFVDMPDVASLSLVFRASLILVIFIIIKNLFFAFVFYIQAVIVTRQRVLLCDTMFHAYQNAPYEWHLQRNSSELIRNIQNDTSQIIIGVLIPLLDLIMSVIMTIFIISVMIAGTSMATILSLLVTGTGLFLIIRISQSKLRNIGEIMRVETREMIQAIQQGFGALVDARITGSEEYLRIKHKVSLLNQSHATRARQVIERITPYAVETISIMGLLVIFFILIRAKGSLQSTIPLLALLAVATMRLKQMISKIAAAINKINATRAYIPGITGDLVEIRDFLENSRRQEEMAAITGGFNELTIKDVCYTYPGTEIPAIKKISLSIYKGQSVAFVGTTGCGKSTMVNLILGLLKPQQGNILVNGINIFSDLRGWQGKLGYIPQSIFLIDDSIQANIAFGVDEKDVDKEKLMAVIRMSCLDEFINDLPYGVNTMVGERGVRISGGERQRLGIARALYTDPEVLIMDEATSALDTGTEAKVMDAIRKIKKGRTLIMIAHRLSTVEECDCLFLLNNGKLEGQGSFRELKQSSDIFSKMVKKD